MLKKQLLVLRSMNKMMHRHRKLVLQTSGVARVGRLEGQRGDWPQRVQGFTPGKVFADHTLKNLRKCPTL